MSVLDWEAGQQSTHPPMFNWKFLLLIIMDISGIFIQILSGVFYDFFFPQNSTKCLPFYFEQFIPEQN